MFYLNKIIGYVICPIGIAVFLWFCGYLCGHIQSEWRKIKWVIYLAATLWLWFWSSTFGVRTVGFALEREFLVDGRVPCVESYPKADAIIILGGGMGINTNFMTYAKMFGSADRVWHGVRLFKAGKSDRIFASGGCAELGTGQLLKDFGIPRKAITFAESPRNTEEEARFIAEVMKEEKNRGATVASISYTRPRVLLVTSAWHMKRAMLMYQKYAPELEVIPAATDWNYAMIYFQPWSFKDFLPGSDCLLNSAVAMHEWVGYLGYKWFR